MANMDYIDPEGYWIDPDRNIHRTSIPDPDDCYGRVLRSGVEPHP
jgi:hypothetical protein